MQSVPSRTSSKSRAIREELSPIASRDSESNAVLADRSVSLRGALARYFQRRVRDAQEVDDLIQEVFLRIVRRGASGEHEQLDGYIFKTAASVLADRGRRRKVRLADRHVPLEPERLEAEAPGAERTLELRATC